LYLSEIMPKGGLEPPLQPSGDIDTDTTEPVQTHTETQQINTLANSALAAEKQTFPEHPNDISLHEKCVTCVHQADAFTPDDLGEVIAAWEHIPAAVRAGIVAMVRASRQA
jgi:hypothetical protein